MSNDVNLHLWLDQKANADLTVTLEHILRSIPVPQHADYDGRRFSRFERIHIYDTGFSQMVLDKNIATNNVSEVLAECKRFVGAKFHYEISSVFDCHLYNAENKRLEPTVRPLTINFYGSQFGWQGLEFKCYGPVRFDFSNTKTFQVPPTLVDHIKAVGNQRGDTGQWLRMLPQINRNFEVVSGLAKQLVFALNPMHLLICTDLEVNPLTAHSIYHRELQDYVKDLQRIATLHEYGGVYFCDVAPTEPAFIPARKSPPNYGHLRDRYAAGTEKQFIEMLQPVVNNILVNPKMLRRTDSEITRCFENLSSTSVEKLNDSYYLSVSDAPFSYLEEPYFKLYEAMYDKADGSSNRV